MATSFRIHPAIGVARVGSSDEYYLGPETMAGTEIGNPSKGGLPIQPGTDNTPITSKGLRDAEGKLKRQAARFRIYQYQFDDASGQSWPAQNSEEIKLGSEVDGKKVVDILWTVHLANKKAMCWQHADIAAFEGDNRPPLRNAQFAGGDEQERIRKLIIDAGPRAISASSGQGAEFDAATVASFASNASHAVEAIADYPKQFPGIQQLPADGYSRAISTLGSIQTEGETGRLIVLGGHGKACGFDEQGKITSGVPLNRDVDNNNWFDDIGDGPVNAIIVFEDGSSKEVEGAAWVISSDPAYAPQIANVVSLWDDVYHTWLQNLQLQPHIYHKGQYNQDYKTHAATEVQPFFTAASLQRWNVHLPFGAINAHDKLKDINAIDNRFYLSNFVRDPDKQLDQRDDAKQMPLSLGDHGKSFLSVTPSQYFFFSQWVDEVETSEAPPQTGEGEQLDKSVLYNCLGGRFSPGIEMSFPCRDVNLYQQNWNNGNGGPFRINAQAFDYQNVKAEEPLLDIGYTPLQSHKVQPGDLSKFMAIPWHTDYNSCATHLPSPNPGGQLTAENIEQATDLNPNNINTILYASWPAQRPVAVYTFEDVVHNQGYLYTNKTAVNPRFSVRGDGTEAQEKLMDGLNVAAESVGRFQKREDFVEHWDKVGFVLQKTAIAEDGHDKIQQDCYLEVQSQFDVDKSNLSENWRNTAIDKLYQPPPFPQTPAVPDDDN